MAIVPVINVYANGTACAYRIDQASDAQLLIDDLRQFLLAGVPMDILPGTMDDKRFESISDFQGW